MATEALPVMARTCCWKYPRYKISSQKPAVADTASQAEISSRPCGGKLSGPREPCGGPIKYQAKRAVAVHNTQKGAAMAKSLAACFQLVHLPPVSPRRPWRSLTPAQMKRSISHSPAMLTRYSRAWPRGSAPAPPPAPGGDILLRRVPPQAKPAWVRRKMRVLNQGGIRRRGAGNGAG